MSSSYVQYNNNNRKPGKHAGKNRIVEIKTNNIANTTKKSNSYYSLNYRPFAATSDDPNIREQAGEKSQPTNTLLVKHNRLLRARDRQPQKNDFSERDPLYDTLWRHIENDFFIPSSEESVWSAVDSATAEYSSLQEDVEEVKSVDEVIYVEEVEEEPIVEPKYLLIPRTFRSHAWLVDALAEALCMVLIAFLAALYASVAVCLLTHHFLDSDDETTSECIFHLDPGRMDVVQVSVFPWFSFRAVLEHSGMTSWCNTSLEDTRNWFWANLANISEWFKTNLENITHFLNISLENILEWLVVFLFKDVDKS